MIPKVHHWKTLHKMEASGFINACCINMNTCVYIYIMCVCPNTHVTTCTLLYIWTFQPLTLIPSTLIVCTRPSFWMIRCLSVAPRTACWCYFGQIQPIVVRLVAAISADPGLRQGRGGAWDHRRCGACILLACHYTLPSASSDKAPRAQSQHVTATLHASNATTLARPQTLKMPKTLRASLDQALRPQPSVVKGVSASRLSKP